MLHLLTVTTFIPVDLPFIFALIIILICLILKVRRHISTLVRF